MRTFVGFVGVMALAGCLPITAEPGHAPPPAAAAEPGVAAGSDSAATGSAARGPGATLVLQPGDVVRVAVWRSPELSGDFVVGVNGALRHPLYQEVPVAGIPIPEVEQRLKDFLSKLQTNPEVVVEPLFTVVVGGQVQAPRVYQLPRETTIAMAIAQAGGPTADARMDRVLLRRDGREYQLDLARVDAAWANSTIRSGDQIIVTRRSRVFQEVVLPIVGVVGALASIINLARR